MKKVGATGSTPKKPMHVVFAHHKTQMILFFFRYKTENDVDYLGIP